MTRDEFVFWYFEEFQKDPLYEDMAQTVEGSPYHRERSVATHTDMVVSNYLTFVQDNGIWLPEDFAGAFAAAFHDVGKPAAEIKKYREDRGDYNAYNGHELLSARLWEDWISRNWTVMSNRFGLTPFDIYRIGYMIEFHKPWDIKKKDKLDKLALTLNFAECPYTFIDLVRADTWGRICEDQDEKRVKVDAWCEDLNHRYNALSAHSAYYGINNPTGKPTMYVLIGASGSGKSTWTNKLKSTHDGLNVYSLDQIRLDLYGEPYADAFMKSTKDKHFRSTSNETFRGMLRENTSVVLDNTNTSRKNRRFFITEARNRGYHIVGVLFPIPLNFVLERQDSREDKTVPHEAVRRQYMGLTLPQLTEVDDVLVVDSNLV